MPVTSKRPVVRLTLTLISVSLLATACGASPSETSARKGSVGIARCADNSNNAGMTTAAPSNPDAKSYAEDFGIDLQEAERRLKLQESAGDLGAELAEKEPETFVGLHIEHEPKYRVIVRFIRDGEETIRTYVECEPLENVVEVREAPQVNIAQLEAELDEAQGIIRSLGLRAAGNIDEINNRAEVHVTDRERLEAALQENGLRLPERVVVVEVEGLDEPK